MLLAHERREFAEAQELLDLLARGHKLRMQAERTNCAKTVPAEVAGMGYENGAKD